MFFITDGLLITVGPRDSVSINETRSQLIDGSALVPRRPLGLLHAILNCMVDRFMTLHDPLASQVEKWQESLLDPSDPFDDWMELMKQKKHFRQLERICEEQQNAILSWRDHTTFDLDDSLSVRFKDLLEHIRRVLKHAHHLEHDIESLVQIHFSAVAHRTNEIMRVLTVFAGVFLPLSLVAGIFGMNFDHMPELKAPYAYYIVLVFMFLAAGGMFLLFRKKKWL